MIAVVLAALGALCAPPPPVAADPKGAAAYVEVAEAEREAGQPRTALIAYRNALARDPHNARARDGMREVCAGDGKPQADELLEGIALVMAGDPLGARDHLTAAAEGGGSLEAGAHFFLGTLAVQQGHREEALRELALAERDPAFRGPARALRRVAKRRGVVSLAALLAPEWDSNVRLLPDTPHVAAGEEERASDGGLLALGSVLVRPVAPLSFGGTVFVRKRLLIEELDHTGVRGAVELAPRLGRHRPAARGEIAHDRIDGEAYSLSLQGTLTHLWQATPALALGARGVLRHRTFETLPALVLGGTLAQAALFTRVRVGEGLELTFEVMGARERTLDPAFSAWSFGPEVGARLALTPDLRLSATFAASAARYDEDRSDLLFTGGIDAELDVADRLALVAGVDVERELSSLAEFRYLKIVARVGLAAYLGLW